MNISGSLPRDKLIVAGSHACAGQLLTAPLAVKSSGDPATGANRLEMPVWLSVL